MQENDGSQQNYQPSTFEIKNRDEELQKPVIEKNAYEKSLEIGKQLQKKADDEPKKIEGASANCKKCYGKGYIGFFHKIGDYSLEGQNVPVICVCVEKNERKQKESEKDLSDKIF